MKKLFILFAVVTIGFGGCKKNQAFKSEDGKTSEDNQNVQSYTDAAVSDATGAVSNINTMSGGRIENADAVRAINALTFPCGATIDTAQTGAGYVTINYDGITACNNRKRAGSIKLTLQNFATGTRWKDAGAVLQIDFTNYKVTRVSDSKSIKINGTVKVTNISGGNIFFMAVPAGNPLAVSYTSVIHTVVGDNLSVTFDETQTATWNISRKYTYTCPLQYNSTFSNTPIFSVKGEGMGTNNGISSLENWGTTRDGNAFTNQVSEPVVWNTSCGWGAPLSGKLKLKVEEREFELTTTLGVDASGNVQTVGQNQCPYGLKVEWTYRNRTGNRVYGYQ